MVAQRQAGDRAIIGTIWYSAASNFGSVLWYVFLSQATVRLSHSQLHTWLQGMGR